MALSSLLSPLGEFLMPLIDLLLLYVFFLVLQQLKCIFNLTNDCDSGLLSLECGIGYAGACGRWVEDENFV